jgi:hypothetical protein
MRRTQSDELKRGELTRMLPEITFDVEAPPFLLTAVLQLND